MGFAALLVVIVATRYGFVAAHIWVAPVLVLETKYQDAND